MRNNDHAVDWLDEQAFRMQLRHTVLARRASAEDARELADIAFERVAISCSGTETAGDFAHAAAESAAFGAAAVLCRVLQGGEVVVAWPDAAKRRLPVGASAPGPSHWLRALACALLARDRQAMGILCEPKHIAATQLPSHLADAFWPFLCSAIAALITEPAAADAWVEQTQALLAPELLTCGDPPTIQAQIAPLLPMLRALASGAVGWERALQEAVTAHREYFARQGLPGDPYRIAPLEVLGLAAFAHDLGHRFDLCGLPVAAISGEFERPELTVCFEYFPRRAASAEDAVGFLDLEGFPRSGREHTIVQRESQSIARYQLSGRPELPRAGIDFVLSSAPSDLPPAIDAGERVLLADLYARLAGAALENGQIEESQSWLGQAVDALDAVLATIPEKDQAVPDAEFCNPRGLYLLENERGRFERDRLTAYRDVLVKRRESNTVESSLSSAREEALAWGEIIKQQIKPLLAALAHDRSGEIVKRLHPQPTDYEKVFQPHVVEIARKGFEELWGSPLDMQFPTSDKSQIKVFASPAGMLADDNELSRHFPGGYHSLAEFLNSHRIWVCWKYVRPGETSGLAYDGLVWCDDHWAWFPKPYRVIGRLLGSI